MNENKCRNLLYKIGETWKKHGRTKETHSKHKPLKEFCIRDYRMKQSSKHEAYPHLGHFETYI